MASRPFGDDGWRGVAGWTAPRALSPLAFRLLLAAVMIVAVALLARQSAVDYAGYVATMRALSVEVIHGRALDWRYVADTVHCWQSGRDVWHGNSCDVMARPMDYSPLLLRIGILATRPAMTLYVASAIGVGYCLTLLALPVARRLGGQAIMAAAILSPSTVFMVERANIDGIIIPALVLAAWLLGRGQWGRIAAHGVLLAAALIKFYPAAGFVIAVRERRWRRIAGIAAAYVVVIGGFLIAFRGEIAMTLHNVPQGVIFSNGMFGASLMPRAMALLIDQVWLPAWGWTPSPDRQRLVFALLWLTGVAVVAGVALRTAWRRPAPDATLVGSPAGLLFLLAGGVLIGCFLAGNNIHYRATMATLLLPMLLAVGDGEDPVLRRIARGAALIVPVLLWLPAVELMLLLPVPSDEGVRFAVWLVRELLWWAAMARIATLFVWMALDPLRTLAPALRPSVSG